MEYPRPIVVVSRCLGFAPCRYDGEKIESEFIHRLTRYAEIVTVCPEMEIGLGVPRDKIRLVETDGVSRLIQPASGLDVSDRMGRFAEEFLGEKLRSRGVDGFVLKSRSPSCGLLDARIYLDPVSEDFASRGYGMFAAAVKKAFPEVAVEDEVRLEDATIRRHFVSMVFAAAHKRRGDSPGMGERSVRDSPPDLV